MVMSRNIVSYIICVFYFCEIIITIKINKFIHFSYIDVIISVYAIMLISDNIINKVIVRLLDLKPCWFYKY